MSAIVVRPGDTSSVDAFLAQRIYEDNARATGYDDGESYSAVLHDDAGDIVADVSGFTWGGCCYVSYLWVSSELRRIGVGRELVQAVERYARQKQCSLVLLSTHSFQAPEFYARLGYEAVASIEDYPVHHADIVFAKRFGA